MFLALSWWKTMLPAHASFAAALDLTGIAQTSSKWSMLVSMCNLRCQHVPPTSKGLKAFTCLLSQIQLE